jgi:hypothetical protein
MSYHFEGFHYFYDILKLQTKAEMFILSLLG